MSDLSAFENWISTRHFFGWRLILGRITAFRAEQASERAETND